MKEIKITSKQLQMITEDMNKRKVMITETQYRRLVSGLNKKTVVITESQKKMIMNNIIKESSDLVRPRKINLVEFGQDVIKTINEVFANGNTDFDTPTTLEHLGLDVTELVEKLLSDKVIVANPKDEENKFTFKHKGFDTWCEEYLMELVAKAKHKDLIIREKELMEELVDDVEVEEEQIDEMTTSASSGSYETPFAFAKDPNNARYSKTPVNKGGTIIKKPTKGANLDINQG